MPYADPIKAKEYALQYVKRYRQTLRDLWLIDNGPCRECGSWDDLEIDHIDPSTKDPRLFNGGSIWNWSAERRSEELAKCQVLCCDCHMAKTVAARRKTHCPKGHELTPENTWVRPSRPNTRQCKICKNETRRTGRPVGRPKNI